MSAQDQQATQSADISQLPPPSGDNEKAGSYITQLTNLISTDKLLVLHTDLAKFDPTSMQNHYRLNLKDYEVEVSHTKQANSGQDFYVILFNNLKFINEKCSEKIILAYMHLTQDQFSNFKSVADEQLERKRKEAEEKRFKEAMAPIDQALEQLGASDNVITESSQTDDQTSTDGALTTPMDNASSIYPATSA